MSSRNKLVKNMVWNTTYQVLSLLIPLLTIPYVSRVLGTDGVGVYSYTYSIANYFVLFATLEWLNMEFERLLNVVITESGDRRYFVPRGPHSFSLPSGFMYISSLYNCFQQ